LNLVGGIAEGAAVLDRRAGVPGAAASPAAAATGGDDEGEREEDGRQVERSLALSPHEVPLRASGHFAGNRRTCSYVAPLDRS
jgi:hypothetical protein